MQLLKIAIDVRAKIVFDAVKDLLNPRRPLKKVYHTGVNKEPLVC